jgi:ATP/maltotriose-dependent transcriptional regulator MalT
MSALPRDYTRLYTCRGMDHSIEGRKNPAMATSTTAPDVPLTDRQREVVALIAAGCSNDEVGSSLGISARTAKAHCDALRLKLGVARRRQIPAAYRLLTGEDPYAPALVRLRPPRSR